MYSTLSGLPPSLRPCPVGEDPFYSKSGKNP